MRKLDSFAALWFTVLSLVTLIAFGLDKRRAARSQWRMSEFTLILLAAAGGWPGGWAGMNLFRHKTAKFSFQLKFALALIPFAGEVWAWWHWR